MQQDLKFVEPTRGGYYYKDHLPLLGDRTVIKRNSKISNRTNASSESSFDKNSIDRSPMLNNKSRRSSTNTNKSPSASSLNLECNGGLDLNPNLANIYQTLKINNLVNIDIDFDIVQSLQVGHGGWSDGMFECMGTTGVITGIDHDLDYEVTYPSGNKWTFNPALLSLASGEHNGEMHIFHAEPVELNNKSKVNVHDHNLLHPNSLRFYDLNHLGSESSAKSSSSSIDLLEQFKSNLASNVNNNTNINKPVQFRENELVEICSDIERVKMLQRGHGEWAECMIPVRDLDKLELINDNF